MNLESKIKKVKSVIKSEGPCLMIVGGEQIAFTGGVDENGNVFGGLTRNFGAGPNQYVSIDDITDADVDFIDAIEDNTATFEFSDDAIAWANTEKKCELIDMIRAIVDANQDEDSQVDISDTDCVLFDGDTEEELGDSEEVLAVGYDYSDDEDPVALLGVFMPADFYTLQELNIYELQRVLDSLNDAIE